MVINVLNFFIGVIDGAIGGINDALGVIPTFGAGKIQIPKIGKIPTMDTGGIVTTPTLALLAANSKPEAVMPLNKVEPASRWSGWRAGQVNIYVDQQRRPGPWSTRSRSTSTPTVRSRSP